MINKLLRNFIFSFKSNEDIQNMKVGHVINNSVAMSTHSKCGFNFGRSLSMFGDQKLHVEYRGSYGKILDRIYGTYTIKEIETFIVTKQ